MIEQIISNGRFALGKKWFWIGIVMSLLNVAAGLIYGIALAIEKNHRKEGLIIIAFSIVWLFVSLYWVGPLVMKIGWLPHYQVLKIK